MKLGLEPEQPRRPSHRTVAVPPRALVAVEDAAVADALVVDADAAPARAPSPRKGRRPEPLDGGAC